MNRREPSRDGRLSRSEQTRAALLAAAADAFADRGYGGTALSTIYKAAGANAAAISYHFGGKRALYDAVLAESGRRFSALFDALVAEGLQDIDRFMALTWRRIREESTHARIVLRAVLDDGRPPEGVIWMRRERLPAAAAPLAPLLGLEPAALRMLAISMNLLCSRFAVVDEAELCALTDTEHVEDADRVVVEHLTALVRGFVGLSAG